MIQSLAGLLMHCARPRSSRILLRGGMTYLLRSFKPRLSEQGWSGLQLQEHQRPALPSLYCLISSASFASRCACSKPAHYLPEKSRRRLCQHNGEKARMSAFDISPWALQHECARHWQENEPALLERSTKPQTSSAACGCWLESRTCSRTDPQLEPC